jgi:hypothetical protein
VVQFQCLQDGTFALPYKRDQQVQLNGGATYIVDLPYLQPPPPYSLKMIRLPPTQGNAVLLTLSGAMPNYFYQLESKTKLDPSPTGTAAGWQPLTPTPTTVTAPVDVIFPAQPITSQNQFFRVRWVTCPPQ